MTRHSQRPFNTASALDREERNLAAKYRLQGTRYTSYPSALQFRRDFPRAEYLEMSSRHTAHGRSPLSLYVHFPFRAGVASGGARNPRETRHRIAASTYLRYLKREIGLQADLVGHARPVTQMHWGGGTPTVLGDAGITELMHTLASHFHLPDKGALEYSIEIDPRAVEPDTIALLKGLGFNHIRLDIREFDPLVQKAISRQQPFREVRGLVECIRRHDFRTLGLDLIHGLPHQDRHTMEETLRKIIALQPDRVACHGYVHVAGAPRGQPAINRLDLPRPLEKALLQRMIGHQLREAGYLPVGMDHYALPQDTLGIALREGRLQRNFQGYSPHLADDLLGLGVAAISQIADFYVQNALQLDNYYAALDRFENPVARGCKLSPEDALRRHIIMRLMCELSLEFSDCERRFGIDFASMFTGEVRALRAMEADGLLQLQANAVRVTERGRPFLRNICSLFDTYPQQH